MKYYATARIARGVCLFTAFQDPSAVAVAEVCAVAVPSIVQTGTLLGGLLVVCYSSIALPLVLDMFERPWRKALQVELVFIFLILACQSAPHPLVS